MNGYSALTIRQSPEALRFREAQKEQAMNSKKSDAETIGMRSTLLVSTWLFRFVETIPEANVQLPKSAASASLHPAWKAPQSRRHHIWGAAAAADTGGVLDRQRARRKRCAAETRSQRQHDESSLPCLTVEEWAIGVMSHELSSCGIWPIAGTFPPISASGPYDQFLAAVYLLFVQLPFSHRIAALRIALESFAGYEGEVTGYLLGWMVKCGFAIHVPTRWDRHLTGAQTPWGVHQKGTTQVTHLRGV
jgi:hypothetical protein